jgi:hypothetical protein
MAERPHFDTYEQFWPYYVAMHSKPLTRQVHFVGTMLGLVLAFVGLVTRRPKMLIALPATGYGFAWPAHWFIEKNNPATFGHPLWSLRGDFTMLGYMLRGRDGELSVIAQDWLRAHTGPVLAAAKPAKDPAAA